MSASVARRAAREVVTRVRERNAYAHETLDAVFATRSLDRRDAAFATRLAYGTIATRGTLDEAVLQHVARPESLEPAVSDALAVSAYELLFMRTPARAAVSEGVELVREIRRGAAGFSNAVLRKLADRADSFPWGDPTTDISALARLHGHPLWIAQLWQEELGFAAADTIMAANNEPAPLFMTSVKQGLSASDLTATLEAVGAEPASCPLTECVRADEPSKALTIEQLSRREVLVADAAAQFAAFAVPLPDSGHVVEVGAGRGTKTLMLAARAAAEGKDVALTAVDLHEFKLKALQADARELGLDRITTVASDAVSGDLGVAEQSVDAVLVDAPCSGLGTLRRHPDRRWRAVPQELETLASLGGKMLERASSLVRPGGFVVYSTCTIARQENAHVVEAFLDSTAGRDFRIHTLADAAPPEWTRFVSDEGWFQSLPGPDGPDGHFVARLVRA